MDSRKVNVGPFIFAACRFRRRRDGRALTLLRVGIQVQGIIMRS